MSFVLHQVTKPFDFGISNIINNYKYSMGTLVIYLCSGSYDKTIRLWDVETSKSLHVFNGHTLYIWCVDISPLQGNYSNNNDNKINNIGLIVGNGYTICSGSFDKTIRIWDIETTKQLNVLKGHTNYVKSVKYGSNRYVRLWDIRSGQQIQEFNGHERHVSSVKYSPFVIKNSTCNSNVICSGSIDNIIRVWDIRSNKNELYVIKVRKIVTCLKFMELNKSVNGNCCVNLCYGSADVERLTKVGFDSHFNSFNLKFVIIIKQ
ncbi:WD-40 repeat-containing protein [Reticulomyxa filosa]|uniref:WD-40 repeat-containing protein n=1 Tax=Reticulomyxa filosa TaxID=46433 RepID=X6PE84_RETFI|nr:WD-40 repeat-containing protein [Reticulomyxa filosa]|eukprot:ETO36526.1 WD-40 repeat-containing protein [Reticulomyxa filosa]